MATISEPFHSVTAEGKAARARFPWLVEKRVPTEEERRSAVLASAALMARERVRATRRAELRAAHAQPIAERLLEAGFTEVPAPRIIAMFSRAPQMGEFCRGTTFGAIHRVNFVVGLWDERIMPLLCKISSAERSSAIVRDAGLEAAGWIEHFGSAVVPAVVLEGVFRRRHLERAQEKGLTIFWARDLDALLGWIAATR
jgi:hypothetical protein